jgi:hypothetical protein
MTDMNYSISNRPASDKRRKERFNRAQKAREALLKSEEDFKKTHAEPKSEVSELFSHSKKLNDNRKADAKTREAMASQYLTELSNSLGHVVALATEADNLDIQTQISDGAAKTFKALLLSGKINPSKVMASESPHLNLYLNSLKNIAEHKAAVALNEETENQALLDDNNKVVQVYEEKLAAVLAAKSRVMLQRERDMQAQFEAEKQQALESAAFPEKLIAKRAKKYDSYFRKILDMHAEAAMKLASESATINDSAVLTEALVTYNILELLHTSKLASEADLSFVRQ